MRSLIPRATEKTFCVALTCALALLLSPAWAGCLQDAGLLRQSLDCTALPSIDKYYDPLTFTWGGGSYLVVNSGNDLEVWSVNNPQAPVMSTASFFHVPHQGDSDHDLVNYSICDDCRYGIAAFHLGNVLFDLGTGPAPRFVANRRYPSTNPRGGFTFKFGGQQYLLANDLPNDCGGDATLYRFNSITSIERIGCLDVPTTIPVWIFNGVKVEAGGSTYLYLGFTNFGVYIYQVQADGDSINLIDTCQPPLVAFLGRGKGLSVDHAAGIAVTASYNNGLRVYDISNPASPIQRSVVPGMFTAAAVKYPFAWAARGGYPGTERTFLIQNLAAPVELDESFWDEGQPWNSHSDECENPNGAVFSSDATTMYLARNAVFQMIDFGRCPPPDVVFADGFESGTTAAWTVGP